MARANALYLMATAVALVAGSMTFPAPLAQAQTRIEAQQAAVAAQRSIRLTCCRCLDGTSTIVRASTGSAPWLVSVGSSAVQPVIPASNVAWAPVRPGRWVGPSGDIVADYYTFQLPFNVPNCAIEMQLTIAGKFAADNTGKLYVDDILVKDSQGTPDHGFERGSVTPFTWSGTLAPGPHAIRVVVWNSSGPTGLVVAADLKVTCPRGTERRD